MTTEFSFDRRFDLSIESDDIEIDSSFSNPVAYFPQVKQSCRISDPQIHHGQTINAYFLA